MVTDVVPESRKIDFAALKEEMENARKELPFTFDGKSMLHCYNNTN
jgi:hypothetical protein